jgi:hypothetical protein
VTRTRNGDISATYFRDLFPWPISVALSVGTVRSVVRSEVSDIVGTGNDNVRPTETHLPPSDPTGIPNTGVEV